MSDAPLPPIPGRRRALALSLLALLPGVAGGRARAASPAALSAPDPAGPVGIALENWPYPGPVRFLPVTMAEQTLRMAFMDFAPTGRANQRAVLLLHGKNFDSSYWSGPIAWLREAGFRVVVPDQIGFNKSSKPDLRYGFESLARNTMALADALSLSRVVVLGHSTGGALAVTIAHLFPDRIERLVLEDPIGLVDYRAFIPPQSTDTLVRAEHEYTADSYRRFMAHFFHDPAPRLVEPFVSWRMGTTLSGEFDRFARASALTYQMIYDEPTRPLYAALPMPVLLTAGTDDRSTPLIRYAAPAQKARIPSLFDAAQAACREPRNAAFVPFPQCGHVPHLEQPERFRSAVLGFFGA